MKRNYVRAASFIVTFSLLFSGLIGCGRQEVKKDDKVPASGKVGETVELTVEVFDRGTPGYKSNDNFQTKWIQEKFGDPNNIKVKFVPVIRTQEVDKLNVMMASNSAPDVCFTYNDNVMYNYVKNNGLADLGPLLDQYGKNLKKYLGDTLLSYGNWNNTQYAVPAKRVLVARSSTFIRKDWLDKLGMTIPKSTQEFYNVIKAFKEKDPGSLGDKNIPFTFNVDPNNIDWTVHNILESFKEKVSDEDAKCLPNWVIPGYKEGMRFLNKAYNEGLINPQFALDKDGKQMEKDIAQGRAGSFIQNYDWPYRVTPGLAIELKKQVPNGEIIAIDPFANKEGKHVKSKYNPNGLYIIVPKSSKRAVEAIKYLEWMSDPAVLKYLQNGEKGVHYTDENNGIPMNIISNDKLPDEKKANYSDLAIISNGKEFGDEKKNLEAMSYGYPGFEENVKKSYEIAMNDAGFMPHFDKVIEAQAKYSKGLTDKDSQIFTKAISCKPEEFDKTYDGLVKEYMSNGGQEIVDEKRSAYKSMKK